MGELSGTTEVAKDHIYGTRKGKCQGKGITLKPKCPQALLSDE